MMRFDRLPAYGLSLLAVLAVGVPCQATAQEPQENTVVEVVDDRITLVVDNSNWLDVNVFVISGTQSRRVGMVTGVTKSKFVLPHDLSLPGRDFQVVIAPIGSRGAHYSPIIAVNPGDHVEYRIANNLALSTFRVF